MERDFIISCESTADIDYSYLKKNKIPVIFYHYTLDGRDFEDNMGRDKKANKRFFEALKSGKVPATSQINEYTYYDYFKSLLKDNKCVLHIAFGSGMTPSVVNAVYAAKRLNDESGETKITVIDSTCSSTGYGLLITLANEFSLSCKTLNETADYVDGIKHRIHHQFFSSDLKYFKRSGRVSGIAATVATVLGICPIMRLNYEGKIVAYDKVRGKKNAIERTVNEMLKNAENGRDYDGLCFINHSNCQSDATEVKKSIEKAFPKLKGKTEIFEIGNIIGSHCGPDTVAVFFVGAKRADG